MQKLVCNRKRSLRILLFISIVMLLSLPLMVSAQDMAEEDNIFVSIRVYEGVDPADQAELARLIGDGFLPFMRDGEGFVGYFVLAADDVLVTISLFDSEEEASASNEAAREFVVDVLAPLLPNPPRIVKGAVDLFQMPTDDDMMPEDTDDESSEEAHDESSGDEHDDDNEEMVTDEDVTDLFGALRIYDNYDLSYLDQANEVIETIMLPAQMDVGGFYGYFAMNDGEDSVAGLSVFDSEESAAAANEVAAAVVAEHMADWLPPDPVRINGRLSVAGLAGNHDGENLVGEMMIHHDEDED